MRQLPLMETTPQASALADFMPALRASLRQAMGADPQGRKLLVDAVNALAKDADVRLTGGNKREVSKDTLDKWASKADRDHPPSLLALMAICLTTKNANPLQVLLQPFGLHIVTGEELDILKYGRLCLDEETIREDKEAAHKRIRERKK